MSLDFSRWKTLFNSTFACLPDEWTLVQGCPYSSSAILKGWKQYEDSVRADFKCSICHRDWSSARASAIFHFRFSQTQQGERSGKVKVWCLGQKCLRCSGGEFVSPNWRDCDIEEMLENLLEKIKDKFYIGKHGSGESSGLFDDLFDDYDLFSGDSLPSGSHRNELCQACHMGVCGLRDGLPAPSDDYFSDFDDYWHDEAPIDYSLDGWSQW